MKTLKCEVCDVPVPGPLLRCPSHINFKLNRRDRKIFLSDAFVEKMKVLDPEDRYVIVKGYASSIGVTPGAVYNHLKKHFNFKKVGKYLMYAGNKV